MSLPSCILQKRDGTHGYLASDLAAIKYRLRNWNPTKMMYFVDNRQALHFKQLFATAEKAWLQIPLREDLRQRKEKREEIKEKEVVSCPPDKGRLRGVINDGKCDFIHAANGFVSLPEGAMSTRK